MSSPLPFTEDSTLAPDSVAQALASRARAADAEHFDELRLPDGGLRPAWHSFARHLGAPLDDLTRRQALLARQIQEDGITYNVYKAQGDPSRPWSLEVLPLIINAPDWRVLEQGVAQRARLLNEILADVYGPQRLLKQALLPSALVWGHPGYLRGLHGVQPVGGVYLHVLAFDLTRGVDGRWWVVSQRTQAPSGLGYVMQNRRIVSRLFPQAYRAMNVQHLASSYRCLLDNLTQLAALCAGSDAPRVALLTPGPLNETYFEHAYLARYLGLPLVEGGDLVVRDERLFLKTVQGLEPLHGLLRRADDDYCDPLELRADSTLGVPGLMQVVRAGKVVLANALGTGFLESPAIHGFLPAMAEQLLQAPLALPSLPTWWCGEAASWNAVQGQLANKVIRHTGPHASQGVAGPMLTAAALHDWQACMACDPAAYTVQDFMPYTQVPVWSGGQVTLRGASLRVYALADGQGGWKVLPGGMTRIASRESGPVSMQLGGSSLDTWVLTEGQVDTFSMLPASVHRDELVQQRHRPVASRAGENLFWMGRYTERAEQQLRLVHALVSLQTADDEAPDAVLQALSALALEQGLVPAATPSLAQDPHAFESALRLSLTDAKGTLGGFSLAFNLAALDRCAQILRDRLSPAHARLLRSLGSDFLSHINEGLGLDAPVPEGPSGWARTYDALEHLGMQLAAVTGAQTDRMTRDPGWRLLTVGRLIERLTGYAGILQTCLSTGALAHPQGFDQVLDLFDSTITFRARFQRRLEMPALVALLVLDDTNPRSLACVARRLRTELGKLPGRAIATTATPMHNGGQGQGEAWSALADWLPRDGEEGDSGSTSGATVGGGLGYSLSELCDDVHGQARMLAMLQQLQDIGWRLSDEVGHRYFVHAERTDSMVSA